MRALKIVVVATLAITLAACCACRRNKSTVPFQGTEWHLVQLNGTAIDSENYRATFGVDGRVSGIGACNRFNGPYTMADSASTASGTLDIADNLAATKMMCIGENHEDEFFRMLSSITQYTIDGQRLMLIHNGNVVAIFEVVPAAAE